MNLIQMRTKCLQIRCHLDAVWEAGEAEGCRAGIPPMVG